MVGRAGSRDEIPHRLALAGSLSPRGTAGAGRLMCGIAGIVALGDAPVPAEVVKKMCDALAHRGPDDAGYLFGGSQRIIPFADEEFAHRNPLTDVWGGKRWQAESQNRQSFAFGHRRLSILDLSSGGHQPM